MIILYSMQVQNILISQVSPNHPLGQVQLVLGYRHMPPFRQKPGSHRAVHVSCDMALIYWQTACVHANLFGICLLPTHSQCLEWSSSHHSDKILHRISLSTISYLFVCACVCMCFHTYFTLISLPPMWTCAVDVWMQTCPSIQAEILFTYSCKEQEIVTLTISRQL